MAEVNLKGEQVSVVTNNIIENRLSPGTFAEMKQNISREVVDGIQALEVLSTMTEDEFLHVGSRLEEFSRRAAAMAELSKSATSLVSGDEIRHTMDGLSALVESVRAGVDNSEAMTAASLTRLKSITELIEEVDPGLDDLGRVTRRLKMLGLSMIIQNATLKRPLESLRILGEDVRKLSEAIDEKASHIAGEVKTAAQSVTDTLSRLSSLQVTLQTKAAGILKKTRSGISSLSEKYALSAGITRDILEISVEISGSIGNIVTSTQAHDITRQQFESSAGVFNGLLAVLADENGEDAGLSNEAEGDRRTLREIAHFCDRQSSLLLRARDHFVQAAGEVVRNLKSLIRTVLAIRGKTLEVMHTGSLSDSSFFLRLEGDLDSVMSALSALSETVEIGNEISRAIIVVARTAGRLSGFTDDVENIGDRVALIALNAEVKAEGMGQEGRGLTVIAESVQHVSSEAQTCIRGISDLLRSITSASDELGDAVVASADMSTPRSEELSNGLRGFIATLRSVNEKVFSVLGESEEFGRSLSDDIDKVSRSIRVHESVDKVTSEIIDNLQKTGSSVKRLMRVEFGERTDYEMADEAKDRSSVEGDSGIYENSGEFGNNVEFF